MAFLTEGGYSPRGIEEELRVRPTHGLIVMGDGTRHRVENSEELREWVLDLAD